ncbi:MAG: hypothetical protein KDC43_06270 [Saprospiraceae bacterium]|nr:hypothetical protein [Saprospiraceae bacterium]MCB0623517.1 hypothetical protein [Saprospiraceae bacterium]MCB0679206.1 hypothetical protein [Saprospiraceae bacterium]MCB0681307.1 hypothetical protein [Saprospiraceae bacterium]
MRLPFFVFLFPVRLVALGCLFLLCFPRGAWGQTDLSGKWVGTISLRDEVFSFEMDLGQQGDRIAGRSYVTVEDIYATMDLVGELHSGILFRFQETRILDYTEHEGMEWCIKKGQLLLKKEPDQWILEGYWQGYTSFSECTPGKVVLKKVVPRA